MKYYSVYSYYILKEESIMAKQIKSVRFDEDLVEVVEDDSRFLNELFGHTLSFAPFVNEAAEGSPKRSLCCLCSICGLIRS